MSLLSGHANQNLFETAAENVLELVYPKTNETAVDIELKLNELVSWASNIDKCGLYKLTSCKDKDCAQLTASSDSVSLIANPTLENSTQQIYPILNFKYGAGQPWPMSIYLMGNTESLNSA